MQDEVVNEIKNNENKKVKPEKKNVKEQHKVESIEDLKLQLTTNKDIAEADRESLKLSRVFNLIKSAAKLSAKYEDAESVGAIVKDLLKGQETKMFLLIACEGKSNQSYSHYNFITYLCEYINRETSGKLRSVGNSDDIQSFLDKIQKVYYKEQVISWINHDDTSAEDKKDQSVDKAILLYTWIVLNANLDTIKYVEGIIIEALLSKYVRKASAKQGLKIFQKLFMSSNIASELASYSYFLTPAKEGVESLKAQKGEVENDLNSLKAEFSRLNQEYEAEKSENSNHIDTISKLNETISELSKELKESQDRLEYESHTNKEQLKSGKENLLSHLTRTISMEISEVRDTLKYMDPNEAERIEKRLKNIENILTSMRG